MMKALSLGGSLLWSRTRQGQQGLSGRRPSEATGYPTDSREHGHAVWSGGCAVAPHVRMHLGEARLDVGLRAALPHSTKAEALGRMVQLQRRSARWAACVPTKVCATKTTCGDLTLSSDSVPLQVLHLGTPETPIPSALAPTPVLIWPLPLGSTQFQGAQGGSDQ